MKLKLTAVEQHQVREAYQTTLRICNRIKREPLQGKALDHMKVLEEAVSQLEVFAMLETKAQ